MGSLPKIGAIGQDVVPEADYAYVEEALTSPLCIKCISAPKISGTLWSKLGREDITGEIEYRSSTILCYVLGANPLFGLIDEYAKLIGLTRLLPPGKRYSWLDLTSFKIRKQFLPGHTRDKTMLHYARLLIEVKLDGKFLKFVGYVNEYDIVWHILQLVLRINRRRMLQDISSYHAFIGMVKQVVRQIKNGSKLAALMGVLKALKEEKPLKSLNREKYANIHNQQLIHRTQLK
ncbi:hypothetical protein Cgig2_015282 [Carnegiea gigantea]|uniref:Uncharacterized protein n=1 Tax=Carnegiea gigantea TaxID=171969 RepID=A0A9Q1K8J7_9CARY|nr:hypothetical protein Cgig2_015282 [Carnegiea gigantea]